MDVAPVRAREKPALRLAQNREVARYAVPHAIEHAPRCRFELSGQELQQRGLSRAGFAHDRHHLAFVEVERNVTATELAAVPFGEALCDQQRFFVIHVSHGETCCGSPDLRERRVSQ